LDIEYGKRDIDHGNEPCAVGKDKRYEEYGNRDMDFRKRDSGYGRRHIHTTEKDKCPIEKKDYGTR
jgi:hypothetical protein